MARARDVARARDGCDMAVIWLGLEMARASDVARDKDG